MKRVLIVAYYFPPAGGIGSLRLTGFARHLPDFGWEPLVLAPRNPSYHHDPELTVPEERVIRTRSFELSRAGKRMLRTGGDDTAPAQVGGLRRRLQEGARQLLYYPDAQIGWYPPAVWAARRALTRTHVDAVFSSSFPITAHLVARRLHRTMRTPWIAEYRDPWSQTLPAGGAKRRRAEVLERAIASEATRVVTVSPSWARLFEQGWGRRVDVVPNGHDSAAAPTVRPGRASNAELLVGYLGTYYPQTQDLAAAWSALARVRVPTRVRAIGAPSAAFAEQLRAHGLADRLDVTGFLSHRDALEQLAGCSVLLLAGPKDASGLHKGHVVAKVWEYLATGLPIVYVGDIHSDVADTLREHPGCEVHGVNDVEAITASFEQLSGRRYTRQIDDASRRARAGQLAGLLDAAVARCR